MVLVNARRISYPARRDPNFKKPSTLCDLRILLFSNFFFIKVYFSHFLKYTITLCILNYRDNLGNRMIND